MMERVGVIYERGERYIDAASFLPASGKRELGRGWHIEASLTHLPPSPSFISAQRR
jgi:hypothetical protein